MLCIDSHAHCGVQDKFPPQAFEDYYVQVRESRISGTAMFAPVAEIYDRSGSVFEDTPAWMDRRKRANEHLTTLGNDDHAVFPYFFIWNDFAVEQLTERHKGIKWHRHSNEPVYNYDDPRCQQAIDEIRDRNMPVVLEEELGNTVRFINELAVGVKVIIPHLGFLNGGYRAILKNGLWELPNVYADTSLAPSGEIRDYINRFGDERIMFGSDFPFGEPVSELNKILGLPVSRGTIEAIAGLNVRRLLLESNR